MKNTLTETAQRDLSLTALSLCSTLLQTILSDEAYGIKRSNCARLEYWRLDGLCKAIDAVGYHGAASSIIESTLKAYNGDLDTTIKRGLLLLIHQTADTLRNGFLE